MNKTLFLAVLCAASISAFAQYDYGETKKLKFSVGLEVQPPFGKTFVSWGFGMGGSLQADLRVGRNTDLTLNAGYIYYFPEEVDYGFGPEKSEGFGVIPVLAGTKYYFSNHIYGSAQLGVTFGDGFVITYAPGIGVKLNKFDALIKLVGITDFAGVINTFGARIAYNF